MTLTKCQTHKYTIYCVYMRKVHGDLFYIDIKNKTYILLIK